MNTAEAKVRETSAQMAELVKLAASHYVSSSDRSGGLDWGTEGSQFLRNLSSANKETRNMVDAIRGNHRTLNPYRGPKMDPIQGRLDIDGVDTRRLFNWTRNASIGGTHFEIDANMMISTDHTGVHKVTIQSDVYAQERQERQVRILECSAVGGRVCERHPSVKDRVMVRVVANELNSWWVRRRMAAGKGWARDMCGILQGLMVESFPTSGYVGGESRNAQFVRSWLGSLKWVFEDFGWIHPVRIPPVVYGTTFPRLRCTRHLEPDPDPNVLDYYLKNDGIIIATLQYVKKEIDGSERVQLWLASSGIPGSEGAVTDVARVDSKANGIVVMDLKMLLRVFEGVEAIAPPGSNIAKGSRDLCLAGMVCALRILEWYVDKHAGVPTTGSLPKITETITAVNAPDMYLLPESIEDAYIMDDHAFDEWARETHNRTWIPWTELPSFLKDRGCAAADHNEFKLDDSDIPDYRKIAPVLF